MLGFISPTKRHIISIVHYPLPFSKWRYTMNCPNCMSNLFDGIACFQCGYVPPCGPLPEEPEGLSQKVIDDLTNIQQVFEESWKEPCPKCGLRTFNGWDCVNLLCRYGIPEKHRKMRPCILSPDESERLQQRFGIQ